MARGYFRTPKDECLFCGYRDGKPMPHNVGPKNSSTYLCDKCFEKRDQSNNAVSQSEESMKEACHL